uniref:Protein kinase-like domain, phloem protein 2-like protein n=1 Tax=Tanacetum cinerariifolium TaxID=118510 RepID=A0A6L2L6K2_TANCI|nr:protein kinase-like domain, phloem protein 2-like protein [Tanacetum cinerariifolium]
MRKDNWYTIKLWYFFNHVPNAEFDILIDELAHGGNPVTSSILIQGIEFQPIKMREGFKSLPDEDDMDDDEYWEKKLPENYQRYIEMSDKPLDYTTKKELYRIFCQGFLADKGQMWFSMCKSTHGICSLLAANKLSDNCYPTISVSESRFSLVKNLLIDDDLSSQTTLQSVMFSPQYTYACYLVFKFRDKPSVPDNTAVLKTECILDRDSVAVMFLYWSTYPLNIPTIKPKNDFGLHDSSNIPTAEGIGMTNGQIEHLANYNRIEERKDGWMEAMLFKLTNKLQHQKNGFHIHIYFDASKLNGMILEGIEFRPYI